MRRLAVAVSLALAAVLGACSNADSVTNPVVDSDLTGTWNLLSVNGYALPLIIAQVGSDNFAIVGDVITADSGGGFTEVTIVQATVNGQVAMDTIPDQGTYQVSGNTVQFTFASDSSIAQGTVVGTTTLNMQSGSGGVMTYTKQ